MAATEDSKEAAQERFEQLLPWYVMGEMDHADRVFFEAHLERFPECVEELEIERALASSIREAEQLAPQTDAEDAWQAFAETIPLEASAALPKLRKKSAVRSSKWKRSSSQNATRWLVAAQSVAMLAMAVMIIPGQLGESEGGYQTLSGAEETVRGNGNAVIKFDPDISEARLREILTDADVRIVNGPMADGSYLITISGQDLATQVTELRQREGVSLAESLVGDAPQ